VRGGREGEGEGEREKKRAIIPEASLLFFGHGRLALMKSQDFIIERLPAMLDRRRRKESERFYSTVRNKLQLIQNSFSILAGAQTAPKLTRNPLCIFP
jgi:hypothetical protein